MKLPKNVKQNLNQKVMKKTVDGILDVVLRMYAMDTSGCTLLEFIYILRDLSPEEFYALPIEKPKKGDIEDDECT